MDTGQTDELIDNQIDGQMGFLAADILACDKASLGDQVQNADQIQMELQHLHNVETRFYCPQTVLYFDFQ